MAKTYESDNVQTVENVIKLTNFNELRFTSLESKDGDFEGFDIRQWYCTQKDSEMKPTQKGIRIRKDIAVEAVTTILNMLDKQMLDEVLKKVHN